MTYLLIFLVPLTKLSHMILMPFTQLVSELAWHWPPKAGSQVAATPAVPTAQAGPAAQPSEKSSVSTSATETGQQSQAAAVTPESDPTVSSAEERFGTEHAVQRKDQDKVKKITSRYVGEFEGWEGDTVFELENGQVWKQSESGRLSWRAINPEITIKRGMFGGYRLSVEGVNKSVRVVRLK